MDELKPCPFCGAEARLLYEGDFVRVVAKHDGACYLADDILAYYASEDDALEAWNERWERTCKNMSDDGRFRCSSCKCLILEDDLTYLARIGMYEQMMRHYPKYCPNCGARVVR